MLGGQNHEPRENVISYTNDTGLRIAPDCYDNLIYLNYFTNNYIHAYDYGINNKWDNGSIGNYWDDYEGVDADNNGIGDTPYTNIRGSADSQDNFPIWTDEEIPETPIISFGNFYILFIAIAILSFTIWNKQKKN